jgi:hypothetical protein
MRSLIAATLAGLALLAPLAHAAQPTLEVCADLTTDPNVFGAVLTINGVSVPGTACVMDTVGTAKRARCRFPQPTTEGPQDVGLAFKDVNDNPSAVTTRHYRNDWVCSPLQPGDSSRTCSMKWSPDPPEPMPATFCGGLTLAPPAYVVSNTAVYPLNTNGSRSITPLAQKATLGQACDCAAKLIPITLNGQTIGRYCAVQIPNVSQLVVAGCSLKK